jgi:hypothetical protein
LFKKKKKRLGAVAHVVILATQESESVRIRVQGQTEYTANENLPPIKPIKPGVVAPSCHPSYVRSINRKMEIQASLAIK